MILMNDFKQHVAALRGELDEAVARVLESGWFILGKEVEAFEAEFAAYVGAAHAIGCGNGMDALQLALAAWDVGPGDEVITTPNSAFASTLAILRVGATPVFVDINERDYAIDAKAIEKAITPRTKALLPVHIYGRAAQIGPIADLAQKKGLFLLNDACQAHGAKFEGRDVASFGDAAAYSFYPTKNLGCFGDGGMVVCADAEKATRMRRLRDYGQAKRYHHVEAGLNSRLDEMQAAILRVKLRHLAAHTERRRQIATRYLKGLKGLPLTLPENDPGAVWHLFVLRTEKRDALMEHLKAHQVQSLIHYPIIIPAQPAMGRPYERGTFQVAERCADEFLSLPINPELTDAQADHVCAAVRSFFEKP